MPLKYRSAKGSALTWAELDGNLEFLLGVIGSNSTGGWFMFPSGVMMQFLYVDIAQGSTRTITLPTSFPNSAFQVLATKGALINSGGEFIVGADTIPGSRNAIQLSNSGPSTGTLQGVNVLVIGI